MNAKSQNDETVNQSPSPPAGGDIDLVNDALVKAGKGQEEIDSVGTIDIAQIAADSGRARTGVLQQALLARQIDLRLFACQADRSELQSSLAAETLADCINIGIQHRDAGTILGADGKVNPQLIAELAEAGYWGLPIPAEYGGSGASKFFLGRTMTMMGATVAEIVGGLLSIERLIGTAGPLIWKGNAEQKERLLRPLAAGHKRSGFGGTEPSVGCNITKASTYGVVDGDDIVVYGEKLFISNAWYGHEIALLLSIDGKLRVLITELPQCDSEVFSINNYGIHALRYIHNKGLRFNGLRVPRANLLDGDGLAIIFHDLDEGRFAVATTGAARMRRILAMCVRWADYRETFGVKLKERQFIRYNLALQAAYIAGADALVDWSSSLIDAGYQGDVSSMIAKTKATDWLRQVSTELGLFTIGGRFTLHGNTIGDNLADDLVTSVYEGPNPMLGMACIKSMIKAFGEPYLGPVMQELKNAGIDTNKLVFGGKRLPQTLKYLLASSGKMFKNRKKIFAAVANLTGYLMQIRSTPKAGSQMAFEGLDSRFVAHRQFAEKAWHQWRKKFIAAILKYQERLADEQLLMLEGIYEPMASITTMFCAIAASRTARQNGDEATLAALHLLCLEMRCSLSSESHTSGQYKKAVEEVATHVLAGTFHQLDGVPAGEIQQPYK
ncbi:MAG: acyl-CoA/acyl-ACP dehydrogenase [Cyanobacteria bacterium SZAS TMP-1]|nr:acyl-CoA/acyl-ACP dehydrogenase [Cyanobacteria bacterium SZAS TMP-1]